MRSSRGTARVALGLVILRWRPQFAREKVRYLQQLQRVWYIAVDATEFTPPVLTSINRIGLLHFEHVGGGGFLGMVVSNSGAVVAIIAIYLVWQTVPP
jgi:hypothetical protein